MFCGNCGKEITGTPEFCQYCGARLTLTQAIPSEGKSKLAAGLFGIFLGGWGIHRFYLGFTGIGIVQIVVTLVTFGCGSLWGFIEGILILTGSFDKDARGYPLKKDC